MVLCPYCGGIQAGVSQCQRCKGLFEPLSRQATQNLMGPWQIRDEASPFLPGISYERLRDLVQKGKVHRGTVLRGPSTRQFWSLACNTQGVAVLLGECHHCHAACPTDAYSCRSCGVGLTFTSDRQSLGLAPVKLLPGDAPAHEVASVNLSRAAERPAVPLPTPPPSMKPPLGSFAPSMSVASVTPVPPSPVEPSVTPLSAPPTRARLRRHDRRKRDSSTVPVIIFLMAIVLVGVLALTANRTPLDGTIRASLGNQDPSAHNDTPSPAVESSVGLSADEPPSAPPTQPQTSAAEP